MSNTYPGMGWGEGTQEKFGRGEPLQKPSNPDTVKKKNCSFSQPCLNLNTFFQDPDIFRFLYRIKEFSKLTLWIMDLIIVYLKAK